jgi:SepF-like predicted cell division protein (DUF552 family)
MLTLPMDSAAPQWLSGWVALIAGTLGVLGLFASAAAYLRAGYAKATVQTLSENNAALTDQVRILKEEREEENRQRAEERTRAHAEVFALTARVEAQERENDILREAIQGKADVERLVMLIQDHHHEVIEDRKSFLLEWRGEIGKVQAGLDDLLKATGENASSLKATRAMTGKVYAATVGDRT